MSAAHPAWLRVRQGQAPLLVSIPHAGTELVHAADQVKSLWLARVDADWWVDRLYDFAAELDATIVATTISRTVIDVNRDPSSRSLYPGLATTELVPTTTFDGEPLYATGREPTEREQLDRRDQYFAPYHAALRSEIARLSALHGSVVLYDAHSIRSRVPRLFEGELPLFNIGTFEGRSCAAELVSRIERRCSQHADSVVVNGRFKGGWITRAYGQPASGVHAVQMELACRAYMDEPVEPLTESNWPPAYSDGRADPVRRTLRDVLTLCLELAQRGNPRP